MKFLDEVKVSVTAGDGGSGASSFRREAHVPRGGPDGGNGGKGGAVIFTTDPGSNTLLEFSFNPLLKAQHGSPGDSNNCTGADGEDLYVRMPQGTQVFFDGDLVADLADINSVWVAARGGNGGKGNTFFKSATNQSPEKAQKGQKGEAFEFTLVLKSIADIGLLGFPNVGKSTLISKISQAHPKIADYPFTTLQPNLGVVTLDENERFVVADIPGLIPGAHEGKGLGITFLRHIERTKTLVHVIDASIESLEDDLEDEILREKVIAQFKAIDEELHLFSEKLAQHPRIIAFSKADMPVCERAHQLCAPWFESEGFAPPLLFSSLNGSGVRDLCIQMSRLIKR